MSIYTYLYLRMSFCFPFVPRNIIFIFPDMGMFASVKEEKSGRTQKRKSSPVID